MVKFKMTIEVEHPFTLSNDDKDYLRRYAVEAIKKYVASFDAFKAQAAAPSNRDADLTAFMTGKMDRKDYQAKYGVH